MADAGSSKDDKIMDLKSNSEATERGETFWNSSAVALKFDVQVEWQKRVRKAKGKPNYGMGLMDCLLEEVVGNKIELAGPLIDFYLRQIGQVMKNKLSRSKATGLVNAFTVSIPWVLYRHILVLIRGYGGEMRTERKGKNLKHCATISSMETAEKLFSPGRFSGESVLAYRHFKKVPSQTPGEKQQSVYNGRSIVAITAATPLCLDYNTNNEVVTVSLYVQRYTKDNFVIDCSLQSLMNQH